MWDQNTPAITTSLRGLVYEEVRLTCADRDLHSGLFGGAAQNPFRVLSKILGAMHDDNGRVTIPGFYDGVPELPADIKADLKGLNLTAREIPRQVGLKHPAGEKGRMLIEQIATRPTAEINGIIGGYTGEGAKTVIPGKASARCRSAWWAAGPEENPRGVPRLRARPLPSDCTVEFANFGLAGRSSSRSTTRRSTRRARLWPRVGQEGRHDRRRRLDPDRGGLQERARHGFADGRLCARRRPGAFAEREVRPDLLPQGHPELGADPGRVGFVALT